MARYDDILAEQVKKLQNLAAERIKLERGFLRAANVEEEGSLYRSERMGQENRFGLIVTELHALLFTDVEQAKTDLEPREKARAKYGEHQLLHPKKPGTLSLAQVLPSGPVQEYDDYKARLKAAEAREEKIREG